MPDIPVARHLHAMRDSLAPFRYLFCVDLESTCDEAPADGTRALVMTPEDMETIEVGLVVIDLENLTVVDEFQRFVRPRLHPQLTDFCTDLTSITQADVDSAASYPEVAAQLRDFLQRYTLAAWASWGQYDANQLLRDAALHDCAPMLDGLAHFNAKKWHWKIFDCRPQGLKPAVEALGLTWQGTCHRGIDDARNVAAVVLHLLG